MKPLTYWFSFLTFLQLYGQNDLAKILKQQDFYLFSQPTATYGTAAIYEFKGDRLTRVQASKEDCFPGLVVTNDPTALITSTRNVETTASLAGSWSPTGDLLKAAGELGYGSSSIVDVAYGDVMAPTITPKQFLDYMEKRGNISRTCAKLLLNSKNRVVVRTARPSSYKYTFKGTRNVNAKANIAGIAKALGLDVKFVRLSEQKDQIAVTVPLHIAGVPLRVRAEDLRPQESSSGSKTLQIKPGQMSVAVAGPDEARAH